MKICFKTAAVKKNNYAYFPENRWRRHRRVSESRYWKDYWSVESFLPVGIVLRTSAASRKIKQISDVFI